MAMYKQMEKNPPEYFSFGLVNNNPYEWNITIFGQPKTLYADSILPAVIKFTPEFPFKPPTMYFKCKMWHPNIDFKTGKVCISILHEPGNDPLNEQEQAGERWLPIHTVESIVISVMSMLEEPNPESPLNVEANRDYMTDRKRYNQKVRRFAQDAIKCMM